MKIEEIKLSLGAGNLQSEKLISDSYKFIWVGIPKSAITSIISVLYNEGHNDFGIIKTTESLQNILHDKKYRDYYKFTFVRNPWSRVVSCYLNKVVKGNIKDRDFLKNRLGLQPDMSFEDFVRFLTSGLGRFDLISDRHWISQYKFITNRKAELLVDFVGKLENIDQDFNMVCKKIGLPKLVLPKYNTRFDWKLVKKNKDNENQNYYRRYYNEKTKELINHRYKKDIRLFGYEF